MLSTSDKFYVAEAERKVLLIRQCDKINIIISKIRIKDAQFSLHVIYVRTMADSAIHLIENLNEVELKEFLRNNGLNDCLHILDLEAINGETFWNLTKTDFLRWKNQISHTELKKLKKFWKDMKENPDNLVLPTAKTATTQNTSPFLQELERKLINKNNTLKTNDNLRKEQTKHRTDNQATKLSHSERGKFEPIYQNENDGLEHKADHISSKLMISEQIKSIIKNQEKEAHMQSNQTIDSKYYLNMNRYEAEIFLKTLSKNGAYLFRPSTQHFCALSVLYGHEVKHIGVKSVGGKKLELVTIGNDLQFNSLDDIVKYFQRHPIIRTAISQQVIKLGDPIFK